DLYRRGSDQGGGAPRAGGNGSVRRDRARVRADGRWGEHREGRRHAGDGSADDVTAAVESCRASSRAARSEAGLSASSSQSAGKGGADKAEGRREAASCGAGEERQRVRRQCCCASARDGRTGVLVVYLEITCTSLPQAAPTSALSGRGMKTVFA